jgi:hypothetical protein
VEVLFNLAWLVLAATLVIFYCARAPSLAREHRRITGGIALVCALALLFPVISISDDLLWNPDLAESSGCKKWVAPIDLAKPTASARLSTPPAPSCSTLTAREEVAPKAPLAGTCSSNLNRRPPPVRASLPS